MTNKIYVKQVRSAIRRPEIQKKILKGLGLNKMNKISELNDTPSIRGMIKKIPHLVQIVEKS
ncbi:MAG: 50S ribosomal protein L30 [Paracoccaceae bacterium]